jgi:glycosyltransferase involved in cell wall biosynthesis
MNILALEPYYGGSHQALLDCWIAHSRHDWTLLTLPPHKWKWRMRHAAVTFADLAGRQQAAGQQWDVLFASDMLNLAEFLGLMGDAARRLPSIVYFHENQFTYPVRHDDQRDLHFALTNITTALAADQVWFNSAYHRDTFLDALGAFLHAMPDNRMPHIPQMIRQKSLIQPPGIEVVPRRNPRPAGPMRILWAARWEHDKDPETFFKALEILQSHDVEFRISVIGQQFRDVPEVFTTARETFAARIDRWGYQQTRSEYEAALMEADVVVSTAIHEFFGISMVEAMSAGARPLLPQRLAYPEILAPLGPAAAEFLYDGSAEQLAARLQSIAAGANPGQWTAERVGRVCEQFAWKRRAEEMDCRLEERGREFRIAFSPSN